MTSVKPSTRLIYPTVKHLLLAHTREVCVTSHDGFHHVVIDLGTTDDPDQALNYAGQVGAELARLLAGDDSSWTLIPATGDDRCDSCEKWIASGHLLLGRTPEQDWLCLACAAIVVRSQSAKRDRKATYGL